MKGRCPNHLNRRATVRGVCLSCYATIAQRVKRGVMTWEEVERQGIMKPPGASGQGRPRKKVFKTVPRWVQPEPEPPKTKAAAGKRAAKKRRR